MDEWKRVAWSDESRFLVHHVDGCVIRRLPGELLPPLVQKAIHRLVAVVLCFGGRLMVGSGTRSCGRTAHESLELSTISISNIIAYQLHPYMAFVVPTGNGIFLQDNGPCHKAWIMLE
ncbi:hypothetical protein AVEN_215590-1 [Araneus ventricosus]|uniref:Transposable element Tc1 transposase n=1 Tax=Araneus ventricosus TaxID=182803 RepID=A0A4Y2S996_ARAVE|nr:hypothetical protein AVEN_215590-1 [Araneus ventricosus]